MTSKSQLSIYIVDKNKAYQETIKNCFNGESTYVFECFDDGELCFTSSKQAADIVITDYNLGAYNWNGIEFMEEYARRFNTSKFLFLSSTAGVEYAVKSISKGAVDYIVKSDAGLIRIVKQVQSLVSKIRQEE